MITSFDTGSSLVDSPYTGADVGLAMHSTRPSAAGPLPMVASSAGKSGVTMSPARSCSIETMANATTVW